MHFGSAVNGALENIRFGIYLRGLLDIFAYKVVGDQRKFDTNQIHGGLLKLRTV